jgi:hypothetical protein
MPASFVLRAWRPGEDAAPQGRAVKAQGAALGRRHRQHTGSPAGRASARFVRMVSHLHSRHPARPFGALVLIARHCPGLSTLNPPLSTPPGLKRPLLED